MLLLTHMNDQIPDFYTPVEKVKAELERRWSDKALRQRVEQFLGPNLPDFFKERPRSFLVRCVASPDNEFFNFIKQSREIGLSPAVIDYPRDKFVAKNTDKYALCKMHFFDPRAKTFKETPFVKLIDFNKFEGKAFKDISTLWNLSLVDFHHELLKRASSDSVEVFDFSEWFFSTRYLSEFYYLYYLGLFMCHGVLFENMLLSEDERAFTLEKVAPSFRKLEEMFGVKPLIVPVTPVDSEDDFFWWAYPEGAKSQVEGLIRDLEKGI